MKKPKYQKPITEEISSVLSVKGGCASGNIEIEGNPCLSGAAAFLDCTVGSHVLPPVTCADGGFAGYSCVNGSDAA